jgi:uncharacterized protein YdiU (UPF0061 family)
MKDFGFNFQNTYINLPQAFYTQLEPVPVSSPKMVVFNEPLAKSMGLDFSTLNEEEKAALFSGNRLPQGAEPLAQAYAGHQFGHFTMLGDGRAIVWGEHITPEGERLDIQFKGSGRTPYSRRGDGRAALAPMLREYIISEAMHALGIPTTRSLAVVTTGEKVLREAPLPGAILTRVAASHIRVGSFEFAATLSDKAQLEAFVDYTLNRHYPQLEHAANKALALIKKVTERQADLIVQWMRVGFIHGVMNTDNMALSGETIDYGPCAFMEAYYPATVFSSIDQTGRYAYANQPLIAQWNIARLAEALLPLIDKDSEKALKSAQKTVNDFSRLYQSKWLDMMRAKLGLLEAEDNDQKLISDLLDWMQKNEADYTNTFRDLSQEDKPAGAQYETKEFSAWYAHWKDRLKQNSKPLKFSLDLMRNTNPAIIPRNHKVEQALEAAEAGDLKPFDAFLSALKFPYQDKPPKSPYTTMAKPAERVYQTFCGT